MVPSWSNRPRWLQKPAAMAAGSAGNANPALGIGLQADDPAGGAFDHVNEFPSEAGFHEADAFSADAVFRGLDAPAAHCGL
jgi:hypothetical protein